MEGGCSLVCELVPKTKTYFKACHPEAKEFLQIANLDLYPLWTEWKTGIKKKSQSSNIIVQVLLNKMFTEAWFSEKLLIKSIRFSTSFYPGDQSQ